MAREMMSMREAVADQAKARAYWKELDPRSRGDLADALVLGTFEWIDWFEKKPSSAFLNEIMRLDERGSFGGLLGGFGGFGAGELLRFGRRTGPTEGTRVRFVANPASLALYTRPPKIGSTGSVTSVPLGGGRRSTYMPGPGGGLVYVRWDSGEVMGVSQSDLVRA